MGHPSQIDLAWCERKGLATGCVVRARARVVVRACTRARECVHVHAGMCAATPAVLAPLAAHSCWHRGMLDCLSGMGTAALLLVLTAA